MQDRACISEPSMFLLSSPPKKFNHPFDSFIRQIKKDFPKSSYHNTDDNKLLWFGFNFSATSSWSALSKLLFENLPTNIDHGFILFVKLRRTTMWSESVTSYIFGCGMPSLALYMLSVFLISVTIWVWYFLSTIFYLLTFGCFLVEHGYRNLLSEWLFSGV